MALVFAEPTGPEPVLLDGPPRVVSPDGSILTLSWTLSGMADGKTLLEGQGADRPGLDAEGVISPRDAMFDERCSADEPPRRLNCVSDGRV